MAYLDAAGYYRNHLLIETAQFWQEAMSIIHSPDWDARWWDAEESARKAPRAQAEKALGQQAVLDQLTQATARTADALHEAALRQCGDDDPALIRAASGAPAMASNDAELAHLAGAAPEHLFMRKYEFYALGRGPLGVLHNRFFLF